MLHVYSVTVRCTVRCSYYAMQPQKDVGLSIIILRGARNSAPTKFSKIKSFVINSQLCLLAEADRRRASLARRTWACQVQTRHDHATLSERYCSSSVPGCSLRSSLCDCIKAASAFCCQSSAGSTVLSTEFLWTSDLLCCLPADVELSTDTFAWSCSHHLLLCTVLKKIFFSKY